MKHAFSVSLLCLSFLFTGCATAKKAETKVAAWWNGSGKAKVEATAQLIADEAKSIAEQDVFSNAQSVEDAILKQQNVQGFSQAFHTLEANLPTLAISEIPAFVSGLRKIWLPPQQHYTDLAAHLGQTIENRLNELATQTGKPLQTAQEAQVIEGVIAGLSTSTAPVGSP